MNGRPDPGDGSEPRSVPTGTAAPSATGEAAVHPVPEGGGRDPGPPAVPTVDDDGYAVTEIAPMSRPAAAVPTLTPAGWFGKIPALGDFARRRLPDPFVERWDGWLQAGMAHGRARHGDRWLDLYLTFPVWRFLIGPETPGADAWCGVLLPSVDRVGRCFPLTIARTCPSTLLAAGLEALESGLAPLAVAGLAALDGEALDTFDARLATGSADPAGEGVPIPALRRTTAQLMLAGLGGRGLWWAFDAGAVEPTLRVEPATLTPELFAALVTG